MSGLCSRQALSTRSSMRARLASTSPRRVFGWMATTRRVSGGASTDGVPGRGAAVGYGFGRERDDRLTGRSDGRGDPAFLPSAPMTSTVTDGKTPGGILVRRVTFEYPDDLDAHWHPDMPEWSQVVNAS